MVRLKRTLYFLLFILSALLFAEKDLHAESMRVTENLRMETVLLPPSVPDKTSFVLFSSLTLSSDAGILALVIIYDDPRTEWSVDYLELYNSSGGLLAISWLDRFGIRRTAIDRGLLEGESSRLEGVLVLIPEGGVA